MLITILSITMEVDILKFAQAWDFSKKMTFAYLACERLYPNYIFFYQNYNFGNPLFLRKSIDYFYSIILSGDINPSQPQSILDAIAQYTPAPENYDTVLASSAMDACTAIEASCYFIINGDTDMLQHISTMATDSVYMYIQERDSLDYNSDPDFDKKIMNDPLMIREVKIQNDIITSLNNANKLNEAILAILLQLQNNNGKGNLNI